VPALDLTLGLGMIEHPTFNLRHIRQP
jgi:hypothetical protein